MSVGWLLDAEMFDHYRESLVGAIKGQGHRVELVTAPSPPYRWDDVGPQWLEVYPEGDCVVTHGDIEFATRVRDSGRWTPGAFCTVEHYVWSHYASKYADFLLNADYVMLPFGELRRRREFLFDAVGSDGRFFARPDSPLKLFTGQLVTADSFEKDLEYMAFYDVPDDALVVVSSPKPIVDEWRFVIAQREVAAGCRYRRGGKLLSEAGYDDDALRVAESVAAREYQPDPVWVVDIGRTTNGEYGVVEIGGFSFADLYACDMSAVVRSVSAAAFAMRK